MIDLFVADNEFNISIPVRLIFPHQSKPCSRRLRCPFFDIMIWSINWIPISAPASRSWVVIAISWLLGSRDPEG
jgi:hypothetical protein